MPLTISQVRYKMLRCDTGDSAEFIEVYMNSQPVIRRQLFLQRAVISRVTDLCASSITMYRQLNFFRADFSIIHTSNDVTQTSQSPGNRVSRINAAWSTKRSRYHSHIPTSSHNWGGCVTHPLFLVSYEAHSLQCRHPLGELVHPVGQGGFGYDDEMGWGDVAMMLHVSQQRYRLQSLPQSLTTAINYLSICVCQGQSPQPIGRRHVLPRLPLSDQTTVGKNSRGARSVKQY